VVDRAEAAARIKAAVDARNEGADIVILARTDSRAILGLDEAIERCKMFMELGADWTFLEAPQSIEEMRRYCTEVPGPKLANMLEGGKTPILSPTELQEIGFAVAAYPLTLLSASTRAMQMALGRLKAGQPPDDLLLSFPELQQAVGFPEYYNTVDKYNY
jgi:2-methylisocitrate lyase-like PEP mutase family enzyme